MPVVGVSPRPVKTGRRDTLMAQPAAAMGQDAAIYVRERSQEFPLGRIAPPQDVADVVCFVASERASWNGGITREVYLRASS